MTQRCPTQHHNKPRLLNATAHTTSSGILLTSGTCCNPFVICGATFFVLPALIVLNPRHLILRDTYSMCQTLAACDGLLVALLGKQRSACSITDAVSQLPSMIAHACAWRPCEAAPANIIYSSCICAPWLPSAVACAGTACCAGVSASQLDDTVHTTSATTPLEGIKLIPQVRTASYMGCCCHSSKLCVMCLCSRHVRVWNNRNITPAACRSIQAAAHHGAAVHARLFCPPNHRCRTISSRAQDKHRPLTAQSCRALVSPTMHNLTPCVNPHARLMWPSSRLLCRWP